MKKKLNRKSLYFINSLLILIPLAYFTYRPVLRLIGRIEVVDETPARADAIVVLAGGEPGRALEAVDLYKQGLAPYVVVTTEPPPAIYEQARKDGITLFLNYENYVRILEGYGVPKDHIIRIEDYIAEIGRAHV